MCVCLARAPSASPLHPGVPVVGYTRRMRECGTIESTIGRPPCPSVAVHTLVCVCAAATLRLPVRSDQLCSGRWPVWPAVRGAPVYRSSYVT